jgi:UDP-glucose 4-epimerase
MAVSHNIQTIGLRLFNVYGPGQLDDNPYSGVITSLKKALLAEQTIKIYGDGMQTRDFVYIDDVVQALLLGIDAPEYATGMFNICTGHSISINDLANMMIKLTKTTVDIKYYPERLRDLKHSRGNPDLAKKMLQFNATTAIEKGLTQFLKPYFPSML